jgi:DNA-binding MarR family transcriptional regulator
MAWWHEAKFGLFIHWGVYSIPAGRWQGEPITMSEISRKMEIPMSTATRMVDWFVRNQYATRLPDLEDRRIVRIALTESGQEIYRAMNRYMLERAEKIISRLEPTEREMLAQLLEKLVHILDQEV